MSGNEKSRLIVIDPQRLRLAALVRLLEDWAKMNALELKAVTRPDERGMGAGCAMVVMNVGGESILGEEPRLWIKSIRTVTPDVPLVIFSDLEERSEICAAFAEGAKGFIATNLDASLALEALTFLHRGGSYFPCKTIIGDHAARRELDAPSVADVTGSALTHQNGDHEVSNSPLDEGEYRPVRRVRRRYSIRAHARRTSHGTNPAEGGTLREVGPEIAGEAIETAASNERTDATLPQGAELTPRQSEVLELLGEGKPNKVIARDLNMTEATVKVHVRQIMRKFGVSNRTQAALLAFQWTTGAMPRPAK